MGKVYEALKKAEMERSTSELAEEQIDFAELESDVKRAQQQDRFDFLNYSLRPPTAAEIERSNREETARARQALARIEREVALDAARIDPHIVAFSDLNQAASDQFDKLAISLISEASERPLKRILVTSAQRGEGRTCVTINLACALSRARKRVLVIDSDLRQPSVMRLLGGDTEVGLAEVVSRKTTVNSAAVKIMPYGFVVLPVRERVENSAEFLASSAFKELIGSLEAQFDFILFDSQPLLTTGDCKLLARLTDSVILVIRAGKINSSQMSKAIAAFSQESIFGVVLNRV
jgi:capsular exopolysaccharide synthesis family protein